MGELQDGRFVGSTEEAILEALMTDAKEQFGDDLNDDETAVIRTFYLPVARRLAEAQRNMGLLLDSAQIEYAEGAALDLLTALIGVRRNEAERARGEVEISLNSADTVDHNIPKGTVVSTNAENPVRFETLEAMTLTAGMTSLTVPIRAIDGGTDSNVGKNTIVNFPNGSPFPGANVTNPEGTGGGSNREPDDDLRQRAQEELANGSRATGPAIVSHVLSIDGVYDVSIFINDTPEENGRGYNLPPHSFEIVVSCDNEPETHQEIAQTLMDTKAVGDVSVTGENGDPLDSSKSYVSAAGEIETELPNDQMHPVGFSLAAAIDIYFDIDIETTDQYEGDDAVADAAVNYVGGIRSTGAERDGDLDAGDDVIHSQVHGAIMEVDGVYDVNHIYMGTAAGPTGTDNIPINGAEQAYTDATTADHITVTSNGS